MSARGVCISDTNRDSRYLVLVRLLTGFAMSLKLKLFSLIDACASSKFIGSCECAKGDSYAKLISLLEGIHIVD